MITLYNVDVVEEMKNGEEETKNILTFLTKKELINFISNAKFKEYQKLICYITKDTLTKEQINTIKEWGYYDE